MKTLLAIVGAMVCTFAWAQPQTTIITFSELPQQPINGLSYRGVTFSFTIAGTNSTDARFNGAGPGTITYLSDPILEGNTSGVLGFDFALPVSHLSFGVALASTVTLTPGVTVKLSDADFADVNKTLLTTRPMPNFSEGLFNYDGTPASHVSIFFNSAAPRFGLDNLTYTTVPEPSTIALGLGGVVIFWLWRGVRRWGRNRSSTPRPGPLLDRGGEGV